MEDCHRLVRNSFFTIEVPASGTNTVVMQIALSAYTQVDPR